MTESSEAELSAAPIVVACFCRKICSSAEHLRYAGDNGIKKHINLSFDTTTIDAKEDISNRSMREAIWTMYPIGRRQGEIHKLWRFYENAKVAVGKAKREPDAVLSVSTLASFLDGDEIECDFFAYVDESPVPPKQISWTQEERWKPRRELSPEGAMKVVMCEMKASNAYDHAAAQLELRMAAYLAHRRIKTERRDLEASTVFACVALFLSETVVADAKRMLVSTEFQAACPLVAEFYKAEKCLVLSEKDRIFTEPSLASLAHVPPVMSLPTTFPPLFLLDEENMPALIGNRILIKT